ncbi:MAG: hypothetical protein ACI4JQ_02025 [Ruminococcus sp.]
MKKNKFVKHCTSYICDKHTAQEYVNENPKGEYTSTDAENVYRIYRKKEESKRVVGSACTNQLSPLQSYLDGVYAGVCRTTKTYD